MATAQCSTAFRAVFKKSETVAAKRTWMFHLVKAADSTDATGLTPVMTISKAGAAFAAVNAGTAITELANGWYKAVHNVADLDTEGELAVRIAVATADTLNISHKVAAVVDGDPVTLADASLTAAKYSADGISASQGKVTTKGPNHVATITQVAPSFARSMKGHIDNVVSLSGVFGGATILVESTEDETIGSPVWTDRSAGGLTGAGVVTVTGPHSAIRIRASAGASGTTAVVTAITTRQVG
jgi:hypothetical protein